eukprot:751899-Hanusia_phi.AAC.3
MLLLRHCLHARTQSELARAYEDIHLFKEACFEHELTAQVDISEDLQPAPVQEEAAEVQIGAGERAGNLFGRKRLALGPIKGRHALPCRIPHLQQPLQPQPVVGAEPVEVSLVQAAKELACSLPRALARPDRAPRLLLRFLRRLRSPRPTKHQPLQVEPCPPNDDGQFTPRTDVSDGCPSMLRKVGSVVLFSWIHHIQEVVPRLSLLLGRGLVRPDVHPLVHLHRVCRHELGVELVCLRQDFRHG